MDSVKDIATLSFSFTAGIAAGLAFCSFAMTHGTNILYASGAMSFFIATSSLAYTGQKSPGKIATPLIPILYFIIGISCASMDFIGRIGEPDTETMLTDITCRCRSMISSIPFKHESTSSLVNALLTGDRSGLDKATISTFRDSGASHILALSGLHLGIIYAILLKITYIFGMKPVAKKLRSLFIITISGLYTIATGAGPSLVRAFLFITLNETAKIMHRKIPPLRVYCTALLIQVSLCPSVVKSAGFQLSYLAMAGIFILYPKLKAWYPAMEKEQNIAYMISELPRKIWNGAALAISCQIFTGPVAWMHFGSFPKYFLLTNLFALPIANILITSAISTILLYAVGICPTILIDITDTVATILIKTTEIISSM